MWQGIGGSKGGVSTCLGKNSFVFMQFSGKNWLNNRLVPPSWKLPPPKLIWEILDPPVQGKVLSILSALEIVTISVGKYKIAKRKVEFLHLCVRYSCVFLKGKASRCLSSPHRYFTPFCGKTRDHKLPMTKTFSGKIRNRIASCMKYEIF